MLSTRIFLCSNNKLQDEARVGLVVLIFLHVKYGMVMICNIVHCRSPSPQFLGPRKLFRAIQNFPNVRHFPHQMHAIRFEEDSRVSLQRAAEVQAAPPEFN